MGVDYDAEFGIGFEILAFPETLDEDLDDAKETMLDETLHGNPYSYMQWGDGCYGGTDHYAVTLNKLPEYVSAEGFGQLQIDLVNLHDFLLAKGFKISDKWLCGGLSIW